MKHILSPIALILILFTFCILTACIVSDTVDQTNQYLSLADAAYRTGNIIEAQHCLQCASDQWKSRQVFCGTVLKHDEVDLVIVELARLQSYADHGDDEEFYSNCAALQASLSHIREMEWPYLQNIL